MPDVMPVGVARTPYRSRAECPRQPDPDGPECRIEIDPAYAAGLDGLSDADAVEVLLWFHEADRRTLTAHPQGDPSRPVRGVFALRSPDRPNPVALSRVPVEAVADGVVVVRGLDALDGTPVLDLKPARGA